MKECSLNGAKHILVDERIYCANKNGNMFQTRAMKYCEEHNATLPLPLSSLEFEVFSNLTSPNKAWIGISDPSNSGKRGNWRDVQNNKPDYIKLWVYIFLWDLKNLLNLNHSKWHKTEPNNGGTAAYYNISGVYDANKTENHTVVCVQNVACKYLRVNNLM